MVGSASKAMTDVRRECGGVMERFCELSTLSRDDLDVLLKVWQRERCLPSANPDELVQVLLDALADHYGATPVLVRDAVLAVAAVLQSQG